MDIQGIDIAQDLIPDDSKLQTVAVFAQEMVDIEAEVAVYGAKVKLLAERYEQVAANLLPDAMTSAGLSEFKLENGTVVAIKDDMSISVPKKNLSAVCTWLRDNKHEDIIKNQIEVPIAKGKDERATELENLLREAKFVYTRVENVHSGTLKALLKEQRAKGVELDLKLFGAYEWRKAEVTLPPVD